MKWRCDHAGFMGLFAANLYGVGVAVLLLIVKALFKDKLPPKWQFAVWGILGILMLIPAGLGGRYILFHWQLVVEIIKSWVGDYSFTRVLFPLPVITSVPRTGAEWLFAAYVLGVVIHLLKYGISYGKLRRLVRTGSEPSRQKLEQIQAIAQEQGIRLCRVVEVEKLPGAFLCGVLRPVLVLPAQGALDEKIILHELFHLKNRDTLWSVLTCVLRSIHWCNPLLVFCANRVLKDLEFRCDQYVLEQLEGEERRAYGHILLSMANDKFSRTPGSTCIHNGGKSIRERIENIARFKKYPRGMGLVSVCVLILLLIPLTVGTQASSVQAFPGSVSMTLASARSIACTTAAGAFDAYGKAVLDRNGYYRAMCAPQALQADIQREMVEKEKAGIYPVWDPGLLEMANRQKGYYIYNLTHINSTTCQGLLVVELSYPPDGKEAEWNMVYLAVQSLQVEKENGRWVATAMEDFRYVEARTQNMGWGCRELPGRVYAGEAKDFRIEVSYQTIHSIDSQKTDSGDYGMWPATYYDTTPKPNGKFTSAARAYQTACIYLGSQESKSSITQIGLSVSPVYAGEKRPAGLRVPSGDHAAGSSSTGEQWISKALSPGWDSTICMDGGGNGMDPTKDAEHPAYYAAELYLNNQKVAALDLILQEGDAQ